MDMASYVFFFFLFFCSALGELNFHFLQIFVSLVDALFSLPKHY